MRSFAKPSQQSQAQKANLASVFAEGRQAKCSASNDAEFGSAEGSSTKRLPTHGGPDGWKSLTPGH